MKYSLRTSFANELQGWFDTTTHDERKVSAKRFLVGEATEVLKSIGVRDCPIYFGGSKIEKILEKNTSMNIDVIKQAINLLEAPILIMQSRTVDGSIVLFGDVYTSGGKPVMLSLLLNPQNKSGDIFDYAVITSAYGRRTNNLQSLVDNSRIYYINENKNRTEEWLQALGLQLPSAVTKLGSTARVADLNSKVNRITEKKSNIRYSRELTTDGRVAAVVDEDIVSNLDLSNWNQVTKETAQVVLAVDEIEDLPGSVRPTADKAAERKYPGKSSSIKVAELLELVNGDAEKYVPKQEIVR